MKKLFRWVVEKGRTKKEYDGICIKCTKCIQNVLNCWIGIYWNHVFHMGVRRSEQKSAACIETSLCYVVCKNAVAYGPMENWT